MSLRAFLKSGHPGTLFTALLYFDFCFAVWVLNGALAPYISKEFALSDVQKGWMTAVPVFTGALMRFPLGLLSQYIGRKRAAQLNMGLLVLGLMSAWWAVRTYEGVLGLGVLLGVAGASFGVALSFGSGWYPPRYKGLAMGIAGAGNSGAVLAMLFAPPLAEAYGWQAVYGLAALPMLAAMLLLQLFALEPPDRQQKRLRDCLRVLLERDAWVLNLIYALSFGGYIGLTSFLPTLFHDQYGIPKEGVGPYAAAIIVMASVLRIAGGWFADTFGGVRTLSALCVGIVLATLAAAVMPPQPWAMVAILMLCFSAMGAANGALFQLVPLRFKGDTAVASSLIGEIGALGGGVLPLAMGLSREHWGTFAPGFLLWTLLALAAAGVLRLVAADWTTSWVGEGGRALDGAGPAARPEAVSLPMSGDAAEPATA